ncbi:MAG: hypothetical protein KAR35_06390 [Candidatus Heimdallarchaeota archaeon]|nr:hypothetical protein [Candidatus Heimdallarchaeota archaeon]MCK5048988.1 hypothetical protein [Candidatus Heimdallarchaeota archaeon]
MSFTEKIKAFFNNYKGLILFMFGYELLVVLFLSTFSKPMVDRFGDILPGIFPLIAKADLPGGDTEAGHATRTIMLYHSLAIPFLVVVAFIVLSWFASRPVYETQAKWAMFFGSLTAGIAGLDFAYFSGAWVSHGIFIFGQAITFYGAILLVIAIWPTKNFPNELEPNNECMMPVRGGSWNWEYFNMVTTIVAILVSAIIGAIAAANFGQPERTFEGEERDFLPVLLETIVRNEDHNIGWSFHEMVVSHLHIMLALLAGAVLLLTIRKANMTGFWFKVSHWLYTPGVIILSLGAWLVITPWGSAHVVINVGAGFLLLVGGIVATYGWIDIAKNKLGAAFAEASAGQKIIAMFSDPVKFALFFQLWWVNFVSTFPGVYVAINLEKGRDFRGPEMEIVEYSFNVGHWHVLGVIIAMMVALIIVDDFNIMGRLRQVIGWSILVGTIIGFGFATHYILRAHDASESSIDFDFWMMDIGLGLMFVGVIAMGVWMLIDHFQDKENGK